MSHRPSYLIHDGFRMPCGFPVEAFASALTYRARAGDVFVTTYPKCGTTWVQHIVLLLLRGGVPLGAQEKLTQVFPHLEEVGAEGVEALQEPRCIKTHLPFAMTPYSEAARYIYVARNPFDCAVSFYHHTRGFPRHYDFADGTFADFFECFVRGEVDFGDYFDNLLSWHAHKDAENLLFVTYEALLADPRSGIRSIGRFLGRDVESEALLDRIVEHSSFSSMQKDQDRWSSRRPEDKPAFIRKGKVGDWTNEFSREDTRRLLDRFDRRTRGTELSELWPDVLAEARAFAAGARG